MSAPSLFWPGDHRAGDVFSPEAYARALVAVEVGWLRVLAASGPAPASAADALAEVSLDSEDLVRIATDAEGGGNPVIPLLAVLRSRLPGDAAKWLHKGLTSQDVVDTALMLCARSTLDRLADDLARCVDALGKIIGQHRETIMVGRTLTQHAVPITFGLKAAGWRAGVLDALDGILLVRDGLRVQCGGAAGTLAAITELADDHGIDWSAGLAAELSLADSTPWHTRRTPVTAVGDALVTTTDVLGHLASDIVVLSRPEIAEVSEPAGEGRGGSSTMPQKRNPVLAVLIRRAAAMAPLLGSQLHLASAQAVDERPESAWHTEWQPLALLARHAVTAASQAAELLEGLEVHADAMAATVQRALPGLLAERTSIRALAGRTGRGRGSGGLPRRDAVDHRRHPRPGRQNGNSSDDPRPDRHSADRPGRRTAAARRSRPSIGTSVTALWSSCAARLAGQFHVVGWDLPGHGRSATTHEPFTMADLAGAVLNLVDKIRVNPSPELVEGRDGGPSTGSGHDSTGSGHDSFFYAGDSAGGVVGLQLLLDAPERISAAAIISSGAKIGDAEGWIERADLVRAAGTPALVEGSVRRWFAPGFLERDPETATALLHSLQDADRFGYAGVCGALATFDVRDRLREISQPVLVATGVFDEATSPALGKQIADGVANGRFVAVEQAAHLPPAEQPAAVAELLTAFFLTDGGPPDRGTWAPTATLEQVYDAGMAVRREVLGDAHVDRAAARRRRLHRRLPGVHHPLRLGVDLDPSRP